MQMKEGYEDLPKIVAYIMVKSPGGILKTGRAYLRMKKRAQKTSKGLEKSMVDNGLPPEMARQLASAYGADLSITNIMKMVSRSESK